MLETMEHFFLDQQTPLQSDAYRIGRRATRSSTREDEAALEEGIEALGAHLSFAEHQYRAIADALGDGPPVTLESFFEEPVAPGEYQLFVTSEIHDLLDTGALDSRSIEEHVTATVEVEASVSEPSSPAAHSVTSISSNSSTAAAAPIAPPAPSAAAMFRAAAAAAVSPSSVVGPRSRRKAQPTVPQQLQRSRSRQDTAGFDSYSVTSDGDDSFDAAFDEINIELTEVSTSNQRVTVITSVSPASPAAASTPTNNKRRNTAGTPTNNKRGSSSTPTTPGKRGRRTNTTSFTLIETQTNYLEDKPKDRTGSFAGEEVLRISSVVIEEDVDILN